MSPTRFLSLLIGLLALDVIWYPDAITAQASQLASYESCGLNQQAQRLAELIINDPLQQRPILACNPLLAKVADAKAREMAEQGRVSHIGRSAANKRLIDAGYNLHKRYPRLFENNVEAIAGGIRSVDEVWQGFKESEGHRSHLLAEDDFYRVQNEIGVGFYRDPKTPHVYYWVVYIAHQIEFMPYRGQVAVSKD